MMKAGQVTVTLSNGVRMPMEGFGVYQIADPAECAQMTEAAIRCGYRLIDTAAFYGNEESVGAAIRTAGVPREELFVTTKLWVQDMSYENAGKAFETSREKLGLDSIDLYLIHQPFGDFFSAWRRLEELYHEGKVRAIGVSNFFPAQLANFCETVAVKPMVNQVELHPFFCQEAALATMQYYGVAPQAWAPLARGKRGIFVHPVLTKIGARYGKTAAQVALRWNVQRGVSVIPKSANEERMAQNLAIWDFQLTDVEMAAISQLDIGHSEISFHDDPAYVRRMHARKIHD